MTDGYKTIRGPGESFLEVKKSKFYGNAFHVESEEEAAEVLNAVSKKYYDARHHCFAYVIGKNSERVKYSDAGEPQGTAGMPLLELLRTHEISDTLLVVTRYFGGILLGTGGLSRAYRDTGKEALQSAKVISYLPAEKGILKSDYAVFEKIRFLFQTEALPEMKIDYGEKIQAEITIPTDRLAEITKKIKDISQGKAEMEMTEEVFLERKESV